MVKSTSSHHRNTCLHDAAHLATIQAAPTSPSIKHIYSCVDASHIRMVSELTGTIKQELCCDNKEVRS